MSNRNLRLSVAFEAIDRLSGTIKRLAAGAKGLSGDFSKLQGETKALQRTQDKIAGSQSLKKSIEANHAAMDEMRRKARALRAEMAEVPKPSKAMRAELKALESGADKLGRTVQNQSQQLGKLQSSLTGAGVDVSRLASEERRLGSEIDANNARLQEQKKRLGQIAKTREQGRKLSAAGSGLTSAGTTASVAVTAPIALFGGAAFKAAMDAQEMESAFDVTFGKSAGHVRKWSIETGNHMERSTQEMMTMAMSYQDLLSKQMDPAAAAEMSKNMTVLTQDLASFKNLSNEVAQQKLFSGLIGSAEPLRSVGVLLSDNAVKAKAMAMGLGNGGKEFSEGEKVAARYALIMEQLADAQGDVLRTQDSTANRLKASAAAYDELKVKIGTELLPKLTPVIDAFSRMLTMFTNLPPGMQSFLIWAAMVAALVGPLLLAFGGLASAFGVLATMAAGLGIGLAPFLGIVALVAAAVAGAAYLIWKNWDWLVQQFQPIIDSFSMLWGKLTALFKTASLSPELQAFATMIKDVFGSVITGVIQTFVGVVTSAFGIIGGVIDMISALIRGDFSGVWQAAKDIFRAGLNGVVTILLGFTQIFINVGSALVNGIINGLKARWEGLKQTLYSLAKQLPGPVQSALGIRSPSRVFMEMGNHLTSGLALGIEQTRKLPIDSARRLASGVAAAGKTSFAKPGTALPSANRPGSAASGGLAGGGGSITVQVFGAVGQSADDLAKAVIRKIEQVQGVAARTSFEGAR